MGTDQQTNIIERVPLIYALYRCTETQWVGFYLIADPT